MFKYGFDIFIISGSYGGHNATQHNIRRKTPGLWHKLQTGDPKTKLFVSKTYPDIPSTASTASLHASESISCRSSSVSSSNPSTAQILEE